MSGMSSTENSTSTTGPITRATRPVPSPAACPAAACSAVAVMISLTPDRLGERVRTADNLADFLGNLGLPRLVGVSGELLEQFVGVVSGRLHRPPPRRDLGGRRVDQRVEHPAFHVPRQQRVKHLLRDRKSTRLNSSHVEISYAVFCLKK